MKKKLVLQEREDTINGDLAKAIWKGATIEEVAKDRDNLLHVLVKHPKGTMDKDRDGKPIELKYEYFAIYEDQTNFTSQVLYFCPLASARARFRGEVRELRSHQYLIEENKRRAAKANP